MKGKCKRVRGSNLLLRRIGQRVDTFLDHFLGGHIAFELGRYDVTLYGFNAMHLAVNIWTPRWGYVCFHPPIYWHGAWWPWHFYLSPNATPWGATYAVGKGLPKWEKDMARRRGERLGHNYAAGEMTYEEIQKAGEE